MVKNRFFAKIFIVVIGLAVIAFSQDSSQAEAPKQLKENILIAKGESGFEYNVVDIIEKHFTKMGCQVKVIDIESFASQDLSRYKAMLLLNAIEEGKLPPYIRKGIKRIDRQEKSKLFISTVAGENWLDRKSKVDAVTGASNKENAQPVAEKIIARLEEMLEAGKEN
jgi:menaquinone-dependent protoporphyrinogen IX oxidase